MGWRGHRALQALRVYPLEGCLFGLLLLAFWTNFLNNPLFWRPSSYIKQEELLEDLFTCPPEEEPQEGGSKGSAKFLCPIIANNLEPYCSVVTEVNETLLEEIPETFSVSSGGSFKPSHCISQHKVAIIIAYRKREKQLKLFLQHIHPFLFPQLLDYTLFVVEQKDSQPFNRGKLFNVGFTESLKREPNTCCWIFHDVDLLPQNQKHVYSCSQNPRHLSSALNTFRYKLLYKDLFGGVIAIRKDQFQRVNGFSNEFFGWGGEDDDFAERILANGLNITRWEPSLSQFYMLSHKKESPGLDTRRLLEGSRKRMTEDGLNNLKYQLISIKSEPLFTQIVVNLKPD